MNQVHDPWLICPEIPCGPTLSDEACGPQRQSTTVGSHINVTLITNAITRGMLGSQVVGHWPSRSQWWHVAQQGTDKHAETALRGWFWENDGEIRANKFNYMSICIDQIVSLNKRFLAFRVTSFRPMSFVSQCPLHVWLPKILSLVIASL